MKAKCSLPRLNVVRFRQLQNSDKSKPKLHPYSDLQSLIAKFNTSKYLHIKVPKIKQYLSMVQS